MRSLIEEKKKLPWGKIIVYILLGLAIIFTIASMFFQPVSAFTFNFNFSINEMEAVCSSLNYSSFACWNFWNEFNSNISTECVVCENTTITENKTIYVDKNCSESVSFQRAKWEHEEEMAKIDKGIEEAEPSEESCERFIGEAVIKATDKCDSNPLPQKNNDDEKYFPYILGACVLGIGYFVWNKKKKRYDGQGVLPNVQVPNPQIQNSVSAIDSVSREGATPSSVAVENKKEGVNDSEERKNQGGF